MHGSETKRSKLIHINSIPININTYVCSNEQIIQITVMLTHKERKPSVLINKRQDIQNIECTPVTYPQTVPNSFIRC